MAMSARTGLIREIGGFMLRKLEKEISARLVDGRIVDNYSTLDEDKLGIFREVLGKAKSIDRIYSLALMPESTSKLKNNTVYIDWDGTGLKYLFKNDINENGDAKTFEGVITIAELPELAAVPVPLESAVSVQPLCINILTTLSARKHLKFSSNDLGDKSKAAVLQAVLQARDKEHDNWTARIHKIAKSYYKGEFDENARENAIEDIKKANSSKPLSDAQVNEKLKEIRNNYVADRLNATQSVEDLFLAVFNLHYRMSRQIFCLHQFSVIKDPEDAILGAQALLEKLDEEKMKAEGCDVAGLEAEHAQFLAAFDNLVKHINEEPNAKSFEEDLSKYPALARLVKIFNQEVGKLKNTKVLLAEIRVKAQTAAKLGDKIGLSQHLAEARAQIEVIKAVQSILSSSIRSYMASLHQQVKDFITTKELVETNTHSLKSKMLDFVHLEHIASVMTAKYSHQNESQLLQLYADKLSGACVAQKKNGWSALSDAIQQDFASLLAKLSNYADGYLAHEESVLNVETCLKVITEWQANVNSVSDEIPSALKTTSGTLTYISAEIAARFIKPYEDLIHETNVNRVMAFIRDHWWKMAAVAVVFAIVTALVASLVIGASIAAIVIATSLASGAGIAVGAAIGGAADESCVAHEGDDAEPVLPRRGSSADILVLTGVNKDDANIEMMDMPSKPSTPPKLDDIVLDMDALDVSLAAAGGHPASSYNPFA